MTLSPVRRVTAIAIGAIAVLLALVGPGQAQQNSTVFPWNSGGGGSSQGGYSYREAYFPPAAPAYNPPANVERSRAFYPSTASADTVLINMTVPADAKITFDGTATTQTGARRSFVSPAIAPGQYTYDIQATWMENGRQVRQSRSIPVQPGEVVQVTITRNGVTVR